MRIVYLGPEPLTAGGVDLIPAVPVEVTLEQAVAVRREVGRELLGTPDGVLHRDPCPTCEQPVWRFDATPVKVVQRLWSSFDGTVTALGSGRSYELRARQEVEVDVADAAEFLALDLTGQVLLDLDALDLRVLLKADLVSLAGRMGLETTGTVGDLRARIGGALGWA